MISPELSAENIARLKDRNRGRVVAVGLSEDGNAFRLFTGMGGRSEGSKNRKYVLIPELNGNGDFVKTAVHDYSIQQGDPTATIYTALRSWDNWHVASNGEQTEGIAFAMAVGDVFDLEPTHVFIAAQKRYKNEGKKNDYTPRITVAVNPLDHLAYLGKITPKPTNKEESYYDYWLLHGKNQTITMKPGEGYFTTTYIGDGTTSANYEPPWPILLKGSLEENMDLLWDNWDPHTRANLVGKEIERGSGRFTYALRTIHPGVELKRPE